MILNRRKALIGLTTLFAAPAIVAADNIMQVKPVKWWSMPGDPGFRYYKIVGRDVVGVDDVMEWAKSFETNSRHVALTDSVAKGVPGNVRVSTVFLGIDHNFARLFGSDPGVDTRPHVFETMVFGGSLHEQQMRYATYDEAERGHAAILARVQNSQRGMKQMLSAAAEAAKNFVNGGVDDAERNSTEAKKQKRPQDSGREQG